MYSASGWLDSGTPDTGKDSGRVDRLSAGNFGDCKSLRGDCLSCASTGDRAIGLLRARWSNLLLLLCVGIREAILDISALRNTARTIWKGRDDHETQGEHIARRGDGS